MASFLRKQQVLGHISHERASLEHGSLISCEKLTKIQDLAQQRSLHLQIVSLLVVLRLSSDINGVRRMLACFE